MKQKLFALIVTAIATSLLMGSTVQSRAQVKKAEVAEKKTAPAEPPKKVIDPNRKLPFHGKVVSVDKAAKTLKISSRTFKIMPDTEITKADKPATLEDALIGEVTGGSYKNNNGTLELVKIRFGPKAEPQQKQPAAPSAPAAAARPKKV